MALRCRPRRRILEPEPLLVAKSVQASTADPENPYADGRREMSAPVLGEEDLVHDRDVASPTTAEPGKDALQTLKAFMYATISP